MSPFTAIGFLYFVITISIVNSGMVDPVLNDLKLSIIIRKLEDIEEKMNAMDQRIIQEITSKSAKDYEVEQTLASITQKVEGIGAAQNEMKREVMTLSKNLENLLTNHKETPEKTTTLSTVNVARDSQDSQQKSSLTLEQFLLMDNQEIIESLKNQNQSDDLKLVQTRIRPMPLHFLSNDNLNKLLTPKLDDNVESSEDAFKNNTEKLDGLTEYFETTNSSHIQDQLTGEQRGFNQSISSTINSIVEFPNRNSTFQDCEAALKRFPENGVFKLLEHRTSFGPFDAYCKLDSEDGRGWTIIQRRMDGSVDFNRDWQAYKHGFGNPNGEYWIGLEKIHAMTSKRPYMLWIELGDFSGNKRYARYSHFEIGNEEEGYNLKKVGEYKGNAGDALFIVSTTFKFSTYDVDNDGDENKNCADFYSSPWWYDFCSFSSINGRYTDTAEKRGVGWLMYDAYTYTHMAIRAVD